MHQLQMNSVAYATRWDATPTPPPSSARAPRQWHNCDFKDERRNFFRGAKLMIACKPPPPVNCHCFFSLPSKGVNLECKFVWKFVEYEGLATLHNFRRKNWSSCLPSGVITPKRHQLTVSVAIYGFASWRCWKTGLLNDVTWPWPDLVAAGNHRWTSGLVKVRRKMEHRGAKKKTKRSPWKIFNVNNGAADRGT